MKITDLVSDHTYASMSSVAYSARSRGFILVTFYVSVISLCSGSYGSYGKFKVASKRHSDCLDFEKIMDSK